MVKELGDGSEASERKGNYFVLFFIPELNKFRFACKATTSLAIDNDKRFLGMLLLNE